jgi:hypothetical protein
MYFYTLYPRAGHEARGYQWMIPAIDKIFIDKKNEIHYHTWREHLKMSEIAKFGYELL